jgi:hypothetical protein
MAVRIPAAGHDAVMLIVPTAIIGAGFLLFPAFVLAVVMTLAVVMLVPSFVLAIVVVLITPVIAMLIAVLGRSGQGESAS